MPDAPTQSVAQDGAKRNSFGLLIGLRTPVGKRPPPPPDTFDAALRPFSSVAQLLAFPELQKLSAEPGFVGFYVDGNKQRGLAGLYSDATYIEVGTAISPIVGLPKIDELLAQAPAQAPNASAAPQPATAG